MLQLAVEEFARHIGGRQVARVDAVVATLGLRHRHPAHRAPDRIETVDALEGEVGEQDLVGARVGHEHRGIQAVEHRLEALVRGFERGAHTLGLGDVGDRGHPAGLPPGEIDQRRQVEARVEALAVLALDAHLEAAARRLPGQRHRQVALAHRELLGRPVGERRHRAKQLVLVETDHAAERGVHVDDPPAEVDRTQAGNDRILHRLAERRLGAQRIFGRLAPGDVVRHGIDEALLAHRVDAPHQPFVAAIRTATAVLEIHRFAGGEAAQHLERGGHVRGMDEIDQLLPGKLPGVMPEDAFERRIAAPEAAVEIDHAQDVEREIEQAVALLLHLHPTQHVAPQHPQAPHHDQRQPDDHDHRQRRRRAPPRTEGHRLQGHAICGRRQHQRLREVFVSGGQGRTEGEHAATGLEDREAVFLREPVRHQAADHALHRINRHQHTEKLAALLDRREDFEYGRIARPGIRPAIGERRGQRALLESLDLVIEQGLAREPFLGVEGRRPPDDLVAPHPGNVGQRRVGGEMLVRAQLEIVVVERSGRQIARHLHQKFFRALHGAPHRLFGPLQVARQRITLDSGLARLQQPDQREHGQREKHHGGVGHRPVPAWRRGLNGVGVLHLKKRERPGAGKSVRFLTIAPAPVIRSNPNHAMLLSLLLVRCVILIVGVSANT